MIPELGIEYDDEFDRHVVEFDVDGERSTSEVVVYTVAEVSDEEPTSLRPLGEIIDPDALDTIFERPPAKEPGGTHISFEYEGYEVTVFGHGRLTLSSSTV
jgi:hypothetical protein